MNLSKFTFMGRLVADPETKKTENGQLTKVRVAVNRKVGGEDQASFFAVEGWDKVAERLATLSKGQPAYFEGEIFVRQWEAKDKSGKVIRDDNGKPVMRSKDTYKCFQMRYLSTKSEQTQEGLEEDAPW
jgi:single-stranded DNA-binding protein